MAYYDQYHVEYRKEHAEEIRQYQTEYRKLHKAERAEYDRQRREKEFAALPLEEQEKKLKNRANCALHWKNMTPEQKAEKARLERERKRQLTPEQKEKRRLRNQEKYRDDPSYKRECLDRSLRTKLGISLIQKEELLLSQDGKCASCGTECPGTSGHVDHIHDDHKFIRGILCRACNILLGFMEKQSERIQQLNIYIKRKPDFVFEVD